jgi:hypothetical protein
LKKNETYLKRAWLVLDFQFLDDNMDVGYVLTLQCAFIGGVKLIEVRCVRCLEILFLEATTPRPPDSPLTLWGIKSWASLNQIEGLKAQHKHPKKPYNLPLDPKAK